MSDRALYTLVDDLQKIEHRYGPIEVNDKSGGKVNILSCSLRECTLKEVELVISLLHGEIDATLDFVEPWQGDAMKNLMSETGNTDDYYEKLKRNNSRGKSRTLEEQSEALLAQMIVEINYAFLSNICNYIAGMTDNFALEEFRKLYAIRDE